MTRSVFGVAQRSHLALAQAIGEREVVASQQVDVLVAEGREPLCVLVGDLEPLGSQLWAASPSSCPIESNEP